MPSVFRTPIVTPVLRSCFSAGLRLAGWKVVNRPPEIKQFVLIGAPHSSNWDFILMLATILEVRADVRWMGKDALFPPLIKHIMFWLGGISINRSASFNTVEQVVNRYQTDPELVVLIAPEGTRSQVSHWKSGFYHIADQANVPIVLGWLDYGNKIIGFGPAYEPSGDYDKDIVEIRQFYADQVRL